MLVPSLRRWCPWLDVIGRPVVWETARHPTRITANPSRIVSDRARAVTTNPELAGSRAAEANINAGLAAARQIVNFFETGDTTFKVN
jgi:D-3-phosphoglycerate dehydrogenase